MCTKENTYKWVVSPKGCTYTHAINTIHTFTMYTTHTFTHTRTQSLEIRSSSLANGQQMEKRDVKWWRRQFPWWIVLCLCLAGGVCVVCVCVCGMCVCVCGMCVWYVCVCV